VLEPFTGLHPRPGATRHRKPDRGHRRARRSHRPSPPTPSSRRHGRSAGCRPMLSHHPHPDSVTGSTLDPTPTAQSKPLTSTDVPITRIWSLPESWPLLAVAAAATAPRATQPLASAPNSDHRGRATSPPPPVFPLSVHRRARDAGAPGRVTCRVPGGVVIGHCRWGLALSPSTSTARDIVGSVGGSAWVSRRVGNEQTTTQAVRRKRHSSSGGDNHGGPQFR
jgi:hypothetical protein